MEVGWLIFSPLICMLLQANRVNSSPPNILLHIRERPQPVAGELKGKQERGDGLRERGEGLRERGDFISHGDLIGRNRT